MNKKKLLLIVFIFTIIIQISIPMKLILHRKKIIDEGTVFKFEFVLYRGYYVYDPKAIRLHFNNKFKINERWRYNEIGYVCIKKNKDGYAKIFSLSKSKPSETKNYVRILISKYDSKKHIAYVSFPFNKFYMNASSLLKVRKVCENMNIKNRKMYALVSIKNGEGVLKDIIIDGKSAIDLIGEQSCS
ncbi:hypothetical protein E0494_02905 [Marinilabiliaceae bacterium JC040]|nr:hypothetical protein [Marinilabiliaceae bacterium JC040]